MVKSKKKKEVNANSSRNKKDVVYVMENIKDHDVNIMCKDMENVNNDVKATDNRKILSSRLSRKDIHENNTKLQNDNCLQRKCLILDLNRVIISHQPSSCFGALTNSQIYGMLNVPELDLIFYIEKEGKLFSSPSDEIERITENALYWKEETDISLKIKGFNYWSGHGNVFFYLINSKSSFDEILIFSWERKHQRFIFSKRFNIHSLNRIESILPIDYDRLYLIASFYFENIHLQKIEIILRLAWGSIHMYDGKKSVIVADRLSMPTSISMDKKKKILYVSELIGRTVKIYEVKNDLSLNEITEINSILTSPSQLYLESSSGDVWITANPFLWKQLTSYFYPIVKETKSKESQIIRIRFQGTDQKTWVITEPFAESGINYNNANGVIAIKETMIVSSPTNGLLICPQLNMKIL
uniref:Arylesterase n=1 Tax=Rhabditophanes sp. KR3021 TaxID=114890 RepID=A0AC35UA10_9BILA